jgi:hypothetical protein
MNSKEPKPAAEKRWAASVNKRLPLREPGLVGRRPSMKFGVSVVGDITLVDNAREVLSKLM